MRVVSSKSGVTRMVVIALVVIIVVSGVVAAVAAIKLHSSSSLATPNPTPMPTATPTPSPSPTPTLIKVANPTPSPTSAPTAIPTAAPTATPTPTATPAPTPTPVPTPTPPPFSDTHTVGYTTMTTGNEIDYWSLSVPASYTVTLTDTMSVGAQPDQLGIMAESSLNDVNSNLWIWNVNFVNSTFFYYWVNTGAGNGPQGHLNSVDGVVNVVVTNAYIEFIGSGAGQYYTVNYLGSYSFNNVFEPLVQLQTSNGGNGAAFTSGELNIGIQ